MSRCAQACHHASAKAFQSVPSMKRSQASEEREGEGMGYKLLRVQE